jgi:hypothetical protein
MGFGFSAFFWKPEPVLDFGFLGRKLETDIPILRSSRIYRPSIQ